MHAITRKRASHTSAALHALHEFLARCKEVCSIVALCTELCHTFQVTPLQRVHVSLERVQTTMPKSGSAVNSKVRQSSGVPSATPISPPVPISPSAFNGMPQLPPAPVEDLPALPPLPVSISQLPLPSSPDSATPSPTIKDRLLQRRQSVTTTTSAPPTPPPLPSENGASSEIPLHLPALPQPLELPPLPDIPPTTSTGSVQLPASSKDRLAPNESISAVANLTSASPLPPLSSSSGVVSSQIPLPPPSLPQPPELPPLPDSSVSDLVESISTASHHLSPRHAVANDSSAFLSSGENIQNGGNVRLLSPDFDSPIASSAPILASPSDGIISFTSSVSSALQSLKVDQNDLVQVLVLHWCTLPL